MRSCKTCCILFSARTDAPKIKHAHLCC